MIDYLAATRLEAAGDAMAAARLYRTIVQRGQTLYVPIQKAQERLAALLPGLNAAEEATGLKEELVRINQRLEQLEKEVGEPRER